MPTMRDTRGRFISAEVWTANQIEWMRIARDCEARDRTNRSMERLRMLRHRPSRISSMVRASRSMASAIRPHVKRGIIVALTCYVLNPTITFSS